MSDIKMDDRIIIAHRGNLNGPSKFENIPVYVNTALDAGFHVEVDLWFIDDEFYLGHNKPQYRVSKEFLWNKNIWCHCKNEMALLEGLKYNFHVFLHENEPIVLTSKGYVWNRNFHKSVALSPELWGKPFTKQNFEFAICTDYPLLYRNT